MSFFGFVSFFRGLTVTLKFILTFDSIEGFHLQIDSEICYWISFYKAWQTDRKWRDALRVVIPSEWLCVEFYILCSLKWVALSQNAVKLTFQRLCESLQWQDAFWLPNCLLNEIVVIFPVILCCICRHLVSGFGDCKSSGNSMWENMLSVLCS